MPKRFQNPERKLAVQLLTLRDGYHCIHCGKIPCRDDPPLQVDHADRDTSNWDMDNLHLLCGPCNLLMRQYAAEEQIQILKTDSAKNVCVFSKTIANELYQNRTGDVPIEIEINAHCQETWERWLAEKVDREGMVKKEDAIYGGAKFARCSPMTVERYFRMAVSCEGEYDFHKSKEGSYITRRKQ
jgi:hypothetical protein